MIGRLEILRFLSNFAFKLKLPVMNPFIVIVVFIHTLVNAYLFVRGWQALPASVPVRIVYGLIFLLFYGSFFIAMAGRDSFPLDRQKALYFIGSTWFAFMLYLSLYFVFTDIIHLADRFFRFLPSSLSPVVFRQVQVISGYILVIIILAAGHYRFTHPEIVEKTININKNGGKYNELKAVVISDLHLGTGIGKKMLQQYVQLVNAQNPDIILIAGDMIDSNVRPLEEERMYEEINRMEAPLGIYFCPGNHEYITGIDRSLHFFAKTKMEVLIDSAVCVNGSFWVIGRNDRTNHNRLSLKQLVSKTVPEQPLFLLDHQPYFPEEAAVCGIDLQISGHTHDGQLWPLNYIVGGMYELGHGYLKKKDTHLIVTSGLGIWGPQFRVGTQSELIILNIRFKE
jgi:predicted MPP superfamily phosphohydrolase